MKPFLAAVAVSFAALTASTAGASTVRLDYSGSSVFGSPNLSETVQVSSPVRADIRVQAGPFRMTDGINNLVAFCFDLAQNVANGVTYTTASNPLGDERASLLNRLFSSHYDKVDTTTEGAAFQVAVWEIVYEDLSGPLSASSGDFYASSNAGVVDQANTWLANLGSEEKYSISYYLSDTNQDLLTASPVPLPAGLVLLGTGLGALAIARRRRQVATA